MSFKNFVLNIVKNTQMNEQWFRKVEQEACVLCVVCCFESQGCELFHNSADKVMRTLGWLRPPSGRLRELKIYSCLIWAESKRETRDGLGH